MAEVNMTVEHNGKQWFAEIMRIDSTLLGREDHEIFTAQLEFHSLSGAGIQSAGGYMLANWDEAAGHDVGTAFGMDQVIRIVDTLGCRDWEHLRNSRCLVLRDPDEGKYGRIRGIASLGADQVLIFEDHAASMRVEV